MGAMPWTEIGPFRADPADSLHEVQARVAMNYDLGELIQTSIESTQDTIKSEEAEGDRFGLLSMWQNYLANLNEAKQKLPPKSGEERIDILRHIHLEEIGNILDVTGIANDGEPFTCRPLTDDELEQNCGTAKPTEEMAKSIFGKLSGQIGRAESICFPIYDNAGVAVGWYFAGYTAD